MSKNALKDHPQDQVIIASNAGSAIASGAVMRQASLLGIAAVGLAATTGTGAMDTAGRFTLTALNTDVWPIGTPLGWDFTNSRLTPTFTDLPGGAEFVATKAKANGETTAEVNIAKNHRRIVTINRLASAGEDTANAVVWDTGFGKDPSFFFVYIINASNVARLPAGAQTLGTGGNLGKITIADTNLAATERVVGIAFE